MFFFQYTFLEVIKLDVLSGLYSYLPQRVLSRVKENPNIDNITEIRFCLNKPSMISYGDVTEYLTDKSGGRIIADKDVFDYIVNKLTGGSMYSVNENIKNGFVTINGGHRVGICGTAVMEEGRVKHVKAVSALCFRVCRQVSGSALALSQEAVNGKHVLNTLIVSPPGCGKTTLLRDLCRIIASGEASCGIRRVGIADERGEIAAMYHGEPRFDIGDAAFVCDGYPKAYAMKLMLRSLSPEVIATDEIGSADDFAAVRDSLKSGVSVIATAHASDISDLIARFGAEVKSFDKIVFLKNKGRILKVHRRCNGDY